MEESTLIKSRKKINVIALALLAAGIITIIVGLVICQHMYATGSRFVPTHTMRTAYGEIVIPSYTRFFGEEYGNMIEFFFGEGPISVFVIVLAGLVLLFASLFVFLKKNRSTITVTDKRVFGRSSFGKQIDLPVSQISALSRSGRDSIVVSTPAGKTPFYLIANREDVYDAIIKVLNK